MIDVLSPVGLRLLLVEDDEGDALLVEDQLETVAPDLSLRRARTIKEALPLAERADCLVVDLGLPDAQGLDALHKLLAAAPDAAIVVLTGLHDAQRGIEAVAAGAQDYLVKGEVEGEVLWRSVRYAVERRRAEAAQRELADVNRLAAENRRLERGLLPKPLIDFRQFAVGTGYRPGRERALVGGDFYDAVQESDGSLHLLMGDVSGHGPDEAALGAALRFSWRALVFAGVRDNALMKALHAMLVHERHDDDVFATLAHVSVDADRRRCDVWLAGHWGPVLLTPDGPPSRLAGRVGPPLGVLDDVIWRHDTIELPAEWGLMLHTDGLVEGMVGTERLGDARLLELLGRTLAEHEVLGDPQSAVDATIAAVANATTAEIQDDLAVLLVGQVP